MKLSGRMAIISGPILFIAVLFYWPLGRIIRLGLNHETLSQIATHRVVGIIWFTIWQAALSAGLALIFGLPGAYLLYAKRFPGQRILRALITVPFVLPTIVVAIAFTSISNLPIIGKLLFGYSLIPAIISAHIFLNYSVIVRIVGSLWSSLDETLEDAAQIDGAGRFKTLISITLPQLKGAIIGAVTLVFLYCLASFGIILVLGGGLINSIETEIYNSATQYLNLPKTSGLALIQIAITIGLFFIAQRFTSGRSMTSWSNLGRNQKRVDRRDWAAILPSFLFSILILAVPVGTIVLRSFKSESVFTLLNYRNLVSNGARNILSISVGQAALNSLRNLVISTLLATGLGLLVSYLLSRSKHRSGFLEILFQLPIGVSSVVLGFGYLITFSDGIFPLRRSFLVTPLVQALLALPLVIRIIYPALKAIDHEILDAAQVDSASNFQIWRHIEFPLSNQAITTAISYAAIISIGEFGAASFLAYGDQSTLPTVLYQLISHPGAINYGMAMAASTLLIAATLFVVLVTSF
jgi:thiamine transport system permease protein